MAYINSILGKFNQTMGGVTFTNWKGINVAKQKVPDTNGSKSAAQLTQRAKFAAIAAFSRVFAPAIKIGYKSLAQRVTEQNVFVARNIGLALLRPDGTYGVKVDELQVSAGSLAGVENLTMVRQPNDTVLITWRDNSNAVNALPQDKIVLSLFDQFGQIPSQILTSGGLRSAGAAGVVVPLSPGLQQSAVNLLAFFRRDGSQDASPTTWSEDQQ